LDHDFGSTYETGILVTMADLLETKRKRYIDPYIEYLKTVIEKRKLAKKLAREQKLAKQIEKQKKKEDKRKLKAQKKTSK